jgi:hypothetical protein
MRSTHYYRDPDGGKGLQTGSVYDFEDVEGQESHGRFAEAYACRTRGSCVIEVQHGDRALP